MKYLHHKKENGDNESDDYGSEDPSTIPVPGAITPAVSIVLIVSADSVPLCQSRQLGTN